MARRTKSVEYRRVRWLGASQQDTLEDVLRQIWTGYPHHLDRVVNLDQNACIIGMNQKNYGTDGFAVSFIRYEQDQSIGTIPMDPKSTTLIGEQYPDPDKNYLQNGFLVFARGNHVIGLNVGRNGSALISYMFGMARLAKVRLYQAQFEMVRVAKLDKIALINQIKVKSIDFNNAISDTAFYDVKAQRSPASARVGISAIWAGLQSLVKKDEKIEGLLKSQKGNMKLSISVPGGDIVEARDSLDVLGERLVENEDESGFEILLRDNKTKIRSEEIAVGKSISIESRSNFIEIDDAFEKMYEYMKDLETHGYLAV